MNVLFIQNLGINESLGLTDLSGFLKSKGHECGLLIEKNEKNFLSSIKNFSPDLFIIPWDIGMCSWILEMSRKLRMHFNKPIVFCGTYPSFYPHVVINYPEVDIICIGEAEYSMAELIEKLEKKEDFHNIYNLWVKKEGKIYKNQLRELIDDLDRLPMPDREIYFKYEYLRDFSLKRFTSGRGCLNSCSFCFNPAFREKYRGKGSYVRRKSVFRIIKEIEDMRSKSFLRSIHFSDDIFTHDKKWVLEFSNEYKKNINLPFTCNATADTIDEELINALKKANCTGIAMGVETGNEKLRSLILNKNISNEQILRAASLIKKYGLFLVTFNMVALPTETIEDAFETIRINYKMKTDHVRLTFALPLPETKLAEFGSQRGLLKEEDIRMITNTTLYSSSPVFESNNKKLYENLFYLFCFGVKFPALLPFIKVMIRLPSLKKFFITFNLIMNSYFEKKFFNITWYSGIRYFLCSGNLKQRTKVFNNYLA